MACWLQIVAEVSLDTLDFALPAQFIWSIPNSASRRRIGEGHALGYMTATLPVLVAVNTSLCSMCIFVETTERLRRVVKCTSLPHSLPKKPRKRRLLFYCLSQYEYVDSILEVAVNTRLKYRNLFFGHACESGQL